MTTAAAAATTTRLGNEKIEKTLTAFVPFHSFFLSFASRDEREQPINVLTGSLLLPRPLGHSGRGGGVLSCDRRRRRRRGWRHDRHRRAVGSEIQPLVGRVVGVFPRVELPGVVGDAGGGLSVESEGNGIDFFIFQALGFFCLPCLHCARVAPLPLQEGSRPIFLCKKKNESEKSFYRGGPDIGSDGGRVAEDVLGFGLGLLRRRHEKQAEEAWKETGSTRRKAGKERKKSERRESEFFFRRLDTPFAFSHFSSSSSSFLQRRSLSHLARVSEKRGRALSPCAAWINEKED